MPDDLDHRLISILRINSRTPVASLARELNVNRSTVTARIDGLVASGVIEAFTIRLGNDIDRDAFRVVMLIRTEPKQGQNVVRDVRGFPNVDQLHSTLGPWDLVAHLHGKSLSEIDTAIERIRAVPGVLDTQTNLLFNSLTEG